MIKDFTKSYSILWHKIVVYWVTFEFGQSQSENQLITGCSFFDNFHGVAKVENKDVKHGVVFENNVIFRFIFEVFWFEGAGGNILRHNTAISGSSCGLDAVKCQKKYASIYSIW